MSGRERKGKEKIPCLRKKGYDMIIVNSDRIVEFKFASALQDQPSRRVVDESWFAKTSACLP